MNKYTLSILPICLALSNCATSPSGAPDTQNDTRQFVENGYQIETIASLYAYPRHIQVNPFLYYYVFEH
jgi:hypothetical protein